MWILLSLLLTGCGASPDPSAQGGAEPPADPAHEGHDHGGHAHDPAEHGHGASHGGQQQEVNGYHAEALFQADGVHFYLTDGDNKAIDPSGIFGSARVTGPNGAENVSLMAMGAALHAPIPLTSGQPASAVLTFTVNGSARSALFETTSVGTAFHDHTSLHGGQVGMWGHYHVELLAAQDRYQVWVSDAARGPVAGPVQGAIIDGDLRIPLERDAATGALSCPSAGAGSRPVTVELSIDGQPLSLPFAVASPSSPATP